ncbi:CGNR zinc finger domain-containing protein [Actinoplanes sp. NPDC023714]|uniref:CGNR zinc finger domain-containing protein n=1 Tax=Actinoplanes sp. NPDC023714 TaxID=3154322 RepID=UPI0033E0831E
MRQPGDRSPAPPELALLQDFANSIDIEAGRETLASARDLTAFAVAHDLGRLAFDEADVPAAIRLREALRDVCEAHTGVDVPAASLGVLDAELARAALRLTVDAGGRARAAPAPGLDGIPALTACIAAGVLAAVAAGTWPRLKACGAHSCRWVYYDRSPGGRSRWCTMSICGSRAKMRAYRSTRASSTTKSG